MSTRFWVRDCKFVKSTKACSLRCGNTIRKNIHLVAQHCYESSWKRCCSFYHPRYKTMRALVFVASWEILLQKVDRASTFWRKILPTCNKIFVAQHIFAQVVKRATTLSNLNRSNVARQVGCFCVSYYRTYLNDGDSMYCQILH